MAYHALGSDKFGGFQHFGRLLFIGACCCGKNLPFGGQLGIIDIDLHEKAVELCFRQRISAFLFQRVLGRQDMERRWQVVVMTGDGHASFLHCLQQG